MVNYLALLWNDKCNVYIKKEITNEITKRVEFIEELFIENEPCRVSYQNLSSVIDENIGKIEQKIKLFISASITIPPGSKIEIIRNNKTLLYKNSGVSSIYSNHQEIVLDLFKEFS